MPRRPNAAAQANESSASPLATDTLARDACCDACRPRRAAGWHLAVQCITPSPRTARERSVWWRALVAREAGARAPSCLCRTQRALHAPLPHRMHRAPRQPTARVRLHQRRGAALPLLQTNIASQREQQFGSLGTLTLPSSVAHAFTLRLTHSAQPCHARVLRCAAQSLRLRRLRYFAAKRALALRVHPLPSLRRLKVQLRMIVRARHARAHSQVRARAPVDRGRHVR